MGDKKAKEDGNRYVLCDAVLLVGRYLDELKWAVVHDFFEEEKIPFTAITHSEIPEIDSFDPTQATVAIRENVNYISLHGGHGSLTDTKRIICLYTEESESLAPVIDDLTLQREFVVFDLRRSKSDPLSIRVRWDTSLSSITEQSQFDPSLISVQSHPYGQKAVSEAKKGGHLIEFAWVFPSPKERKHLLVPGVLVKNTDTWIKYVFREAYGLSGKTLGADFQDFLAKVQGKTAKTETLKTENVKELFSRYEALKSSCPLDNKKIIEGIEVLLQIFSKGHMDRQALQVGINSIL
ncbi:hypothetical protein GLOIN_2v1874888 [Rhizophagus irregularis DAOM 181602=DAOM 197198]|nr:hypothetical protein GLOIN_2v1874888 [Rhizophagus irregularis DAOM 181602=DAOM 197198]